MSTTPAVLALCVNWNGGDLLHQTLEALLASDYPNLKVLVIDSASTDGSADQLPEGVSIVRLSQNLGYAAALNRGLEWAQAEEIPNDFVLALNNDIRLEACCLSRLVDAALACGLCICGPKVLQWRHPDRLEASWGELRWNHVLAHFHDQGRLDSTEGSMREVELLLGCALLIPLGALQKLGPWDEAYFLYHEEVDYLYRAQKADISVLYVPTARAWHWSGWGNRENSLRKVFWVRRNTVYFFRKHGASAESWIRFGGTLAGSALLNLLTFRWSRLSAICRGVLSGFRTEASRG